MEILRSLADWQLFKPKIPRPLGLVPTMGALHEGHLSLIRHSVAQNKHTLLWLFVNRLQFNNPRDWESYPEQLEKDIALAKASGAQSILAPSSAEIHPPQAQTIVDVYPLSQMLEGKQREGHFKGVATVITKLLCLTQPNRVYLGQKDAQQCIVIKRLAADLLLNCEIVVCPTIRHQDGLALSSRNTLLSQAARQQAPCLYQALKIATVAIANKETSPQLLKQQMQEILMPLAKLEYISFADPTTLKEQSKIAPPTLISLAATFGKIRLIDNVLADR